MKLRMMLLNRIRLIIFSLIHVVVVVVLPVLLWLQWPHRLSPRDNHANFNSRMPSCLHRRHRHCRTHCSCRPLASRKPTSELQPGDAEGTPSGRVKLRRRSFACTVAATGVRLRRGSCCSCSGGSVLHGEASEAKLHLRCGCSGSANSDPRPTC